MSTELEENNGDLNLPSSADDGSSETESSDSSFDKNLVAADSRTLKQVQLMLNLKQTGATEKKVSESSDEIAQGVDTDDDFSPSSGRISTIPPTRISDNSEQNTIEEGENKNLIIIVDDKRYRAQEIVALINEEAEDISVRDFISIYSFENRTEMLEAIEGKEDSSIMVLSDVFIHLDIDAVDFAQKLREKIEDIFILMYSAKSKKVFDEMPQLDPDSENGLIDVFLDKHGNFRKGIREALKKRFGLDATPSIPAINVLNKVHTWADDIKSGGKLGKIWKLVTGGYKGAEIRLNAEKLLLNHVMQEQMLTLSGRLPDVLIMGLGSYAIEAIHLAKQYPGAKIIAIEHDPRLRVQGLEAIERASLEEQIEVVDCEWQNMPNEIDKQFDIVFSFGNELECLPSKDELRIVMKNIFEILNPGGRLVMDKRNADTVKKSIRNIHNAIVYGKKNVAISEASPGYPMYPGKKAIGYPVARQENEQGDSMVLMNYIHTDPMVHEQEVATVLTMLLLELQENLDIQNDAGFRIDEVYADFKLRKRVMHGAQGIRIASDDIITDGANFYETISVKPVN